MVLNQGALCVAYLLFFTRFIYIELRQVGLETSTYTPFLLAFLLILPLTLVDNIHFFNQSSVLGMALAILGITTTVVYGWMKIFMNEQSVQFEHPFKIANSFAFIGVGINCFEGIPTVLPIRNSMINKFEFKPVFRKVMITVFIIVLVIQQLLTLAYGTQISSILVFSIKDPAWQFVASVSYCISILLTYPVQIFPATQILESRLLGTPSNGHTWITNRGQLVVRLIMTLFIFGIAYVVPNFAAFLNIVGSVLGTLLQYFFPCLMHMVYFDALKRDFMAYLIIIGFSSATIGLGLYSSIVEMIN